MLLGLFRRDTTLTVQICHELGPFRSEDICTSERAVSAAYGDGVDAFLDEVVCGGETAFVRAESG